MFGGWGCEMGRVYICLNSVGGDLSILDACGIWKFRNAYAMPLDLCAKEI